MPQGFDDRSYQPANPFANVPTPFLDDAAAPVHNPLQGWGPTSRGDANALLPYVDDDIGEEKSNPVAQGLTATDAGHLAADAVIEGGTSAGTWTEMAAKMGHHGAHVLAGEGTTAETALSGATAVAAPVAILGGIMEMIDGGKEYANGHKMEGLFTAGGGALGASSGVAGIAGLAGSGAAATAAPLLGSAALGLKSGRYGDNQVKKHNWVHDEDGNALSASEWAANNGRTVDHFLSKHGHPHVGTVAGLVATYASLWPAVDMAIAGAIAGGVDTLGDAGSAVGSKMAHAERAHHYASYKGIDMTKQEARGLADYDDKQREASQHATWNSMKLRARESK